MKRSIEYWKIFSCFFLCKNIARLSIFEESIFWTERIAQSFKNNVVKIFIEKLNK